MTENQRLVTIIGLCLVVSGEGLAQSKGQQNSPQSGAPQNNANTTATVPPPELYPLAALPTRRDAVLASMKAQKVEPRFIWYVTAPGPEGPTSTVLPVVLLPMSCGDRPIEWTNNASFAKKIKKSDSRRMDANFDPRFAEDCDRVAGDAAFASMMPSLPAQTKGPLKAGQGIVIGIYDKDYLLTKFGASMIGLTVQAATGSYLTTAPLRPPIAAPAAAAPSLPPARAATPFCTSIQAVGGSGQVQSLGREFPNTLDAEVIGPDGKPGAGEPVIFSTVVGKQITGVTTVLAGEDGVARLSLVAAGRPGNYLVRASCGNNDNAAPAVFSLSANSLYYYLPWWNNPVAGDVTLSVSVTAQVPTPTPLTITTNPAGLSFTVGSQTYSSATTLAFPIGSTVKITTRRAQGNYEFLRWSDGGRARPSADDPVIHDVTIGSGALTLVAEFALGGPKDVNDPDDSGVAVTLSTNPAGMPATIAHGPCGRQSLNWRCTPGPFEVRAEPMQEVGGHMYYFRSWSDGGDIIHTVQASAEPITLIANYSDASPAPTGSATPISISTNAVSPGLAVRINGMEYISPQTLSYPSATTINLEVPTTQNLDGREYEFVSWQDGNTTAMRSVAAPAANALFPVIFRPPSTAPQSSLIVATDPPGLALTVKETAAAGPAVTYLANSPLKTPFGGTTTNLTVTAVSPQYSNNAMYTFQSWDDASVNGAVRQVDVQAGVIPKPIKATFSATPIVSAVPVTVATNPPGLWFSVNGIARTSSTVAFLLPGSTAALSTDSPQSLSGVQYTFQGWSDTGTNNTFLTHTFAVPGGSTPNPGNTQTNANPGGQQTQSAPASSASVTAVFLPSAPAYTEQTLTLLSTSYPQTHNPSHFNISTGIVASTLRNPTWTRQQTAPGVTCPTGAPQPCVASPALYQTVQNPNGARTIDPVLFFVIYIPPFDAERKWQLRNLLPAPSLGLSLTSPSTDFFLGASTEVSRGVQLVAGRHIGKINELSPAGVNDPTSSAAPAIFQHFHPGWFVGATFNVNFIQTLFGGNKGGG